MTTQPSLSARMIEGLHLASGDHVLEIGTGLGFQTALLARLAARVELLRPGDLLQAVHRPGHLGDLGRPAAVRLGEDGDPAVGAGGDPRLDLQQVFRAVLGVPVGGGRVVFIGAGVGAVQREAGHVPVQLADVDAEGADRAGRDRPGDLLQVRGDRIERPAPGASGSRVALTPATGLSRLLSGRCPACILRPGAESTAMSPWIQAIAARPRWTRSS